MNCVVFPMNRRQESSSKPARTETTVIFLPDIWSVMPTSNEHVEAKTLYEKALDAKINPPQPKQEPEEEVSPEVTEESKPETVTEPVAEEATDKAETVKTETTDDIKDEPVKDEKPEAKEDVADQGKLSKGYCRLVSCGLIGGEKKLRNISCIMFAVILTVQTSLT